MNAFVVSSSIRFACQRDLCRPKATNKNQIFLLLSHSISSCFFFSVLFSNFLTIHSHHNGHSFDVRQQHFILSASRLPSYDGLHVQNPKIENKFNVLLMKLMDCVRESEQNEREMLSIWRLSDRGSHVKCLWHYENINNRMKSDSSCRVANKAQKSAKKSFIFFVLLLRLSPYSPQNEILVVSFRWFFCSVHSLNLLHTTSVGRKFNWRSNGNIFMKTKCKYKLCALNKCEWVVENGQENDNRVRVECAREFSFSFSLPFFVSFAACAVWHRTSERISISFIADLLFRM